MWEPTDGAVFSYIASSACTNFDGNLLTSVIFGIIAALHWRSRMKSWRIEKNWESSKNKNKTAQNCEIIQSNKSFKIQREHKNSKKQVKWFWRKMIFKKNEQMSINEKLQNTQKC